MLMNLTISNLSTVYPIFLHHINYYLLLLTLITCTHYDDIFNNQNNITNFIFTTFYKRIKNNHAMDAYYESLNKLLELILLVE